MGLGFRLFLLFVIVPVLELMLLIRLGELIGFWPTILMILVTGLVGSALARREGFAAWQRFQTRTASGQLPGDELLDGIVILVSGALLVTPGVLTDVVGLLGLLPPSRRVLKRALRERFRRRVEQGTARVRFEAFGPGMPNAKPPQSSEGDHPRDISRIVDEYRDADPMK